MEVQLQEIIDKIKTDGVHSAEEKARQILNDADEKAKAIIEKAREEAAHIVNNGKEEAARFEKASIASIEQASRNTLLAFKTGVTDAVSQLISTETAKAYDAAVLKTLIPETVKAFASNTDANDLEAVLSKENAKKLESTLLAAFKEKIKAGIEIKTNDELAHGFRIGMKDGSAYYDFSAEAVAQIFSKYLNPKVAQILNSVAKE